MFKWLKNKDEKEVEKIKIIDNKNNYKVKDNGDIEIKAEKNNIIHTWYKYIGHTVIPKDDIVSHTESSIVFKDYRYYHNFESTYGEYVFGGNAYESIENKENYIKYKETQLKTYECYKKDECWKLTNTDVIGTETIYEKTPLEAFKESFESKYKLIETEDEFNDYMSSPLDCNTWCRKKLYNKMKELGLGDGFINQFADLIGNDLNKYHAMIDLANEVDDRDTLMYLYTYKFGKDN